MPSEGKIDLSRSDAVVLIVDVVGSSQQMQFDEQRAVRRWHAFVQLVRDEIIPAHGGRLVKSLGDGLLAEFSDPSMAVRAALAMHDALENDQDVPQELRMFLRAALHRTSFYSSDIDIYGSGVNLAARLATLAGPGETIISASLRDLLIAGLDAEIEDLGERKPDMPRMEYLGECFVKSFDGPIRAYRVGPAGKHPTIPARSAYAVSFQPTIAVIPFACRGELPEHQAIGEVIADGVIAQLSHACHLRVISRLSTTAFRNREASIAEVEDHLGAVYILSGSYVGTGDRLIASWELADARDGLVVDAHRQQVRIADLFDLDGQLVNTIASRTHDAILRVEVTRSSTRPLPTLESFALLLGGIQLLHRSSPRDFQRSFELLTHLAQTHPQSVEPLIWKAKWYALHAVQGQTQDKARETREALACIAAALDREPNNSFALAMQGFVHCHLSQDYDSARRCLDDSITLNPSESFGHLFRAVVHGLQGDFDDGLQAFAIASATSPLDPARYLFDSIGSYLHFGAMQGEQAIECARRSLRQNRLHAHTWRILTAAEVEAGRLESARGSLHSLLKLQPGLTVQSYLAAGRPDDPTRTRIAEAMHTVGLPNS